MKLWTHADYARAAGAEITRMADTTARHNMSAPTPTCPGWDLGALIAHTGTIHRWAAAMVRDLADRRYDRRTMEFGEPEDRTAYPEWLRAGAGILQEALSAQDPDAPMWVWGGDPHVRWWSRRQLHETVVHRADAEIAIGVAPEIDEDIAADGVEEFFDVLPHATWAPGLRELSGEGETISWQADTGAGWLVTLQPDGFSYERSWEPGDVTVRAAASSDLQLLAWGRRRADDYSIEGDSALLDWWLSHTAI
ncbi:maleylpyruvate isomerase family mycothiol-dependent enzyme [Spongiactinospora sp. TRM90649]|uniref:maleylpyruvate isomerase family mycothiol-dependent enzyme n=1 Tax=Spongiactinospora sp. TRM90649 TaxID=3031114 RepID=UPI0023F87061|nr:maleylpyruvate isomerase family mycothiol-dependent enzyme [Spongiactinospora sp. TRM90649]MDF5758509.1 maleylpyruvate isomerase family mycothiol-dependent enzyme [Spongiactinospora sp. TRM90649]